MMAGEEKTCRTCGSAIEDPRRRKFCCDKCRLQSYSRRYYAYRNRWHAERRQKDILRLREDCRVQCLDCGKWFVQLGSHVVQKHGYGSTKEYKEYHDLERKRGIVPAWYREEKGAIALGNDTYKNLEAGEKYRFKKGDKSAGRYKRSHITLERLRKNAQLRTKTNKQDGKDHPSR